MRSPTRFTSRRWLPACLLPVALSTVAGADTYVWQPLCGSNVWYDVCIQGELFCNNWGVCVLQPNPPWPGHPSDPGDDAIIGAGAEVTNLGAGVSLTNMVLDGHLTVLTLSYPFGIAGTGEISGALTVAGNLAGPGTLNFTENALLEIVPVDIYSGATFSGFVVNQAGATDWAAGHLSFSSGTVFNNDGAFEISNSTGVVYSSTGAEFNNFGTFTRLAGGGEIAATVEFNNSGAVTVQSGKLTLTGGGVASGPFTIAPGAVLEFSAFALPYVLNDGADLAGGGVAQAKIGTLTIAGPISASTLNLVSGTLNGSGTLQVSDSMTWSAGTMSGTGATVIGEGATLLIDTNATHTIDGRAVTNLGTATWTNSWLVLQNGAVLSNAGVFDVQDGVTLGQVGMVPTLVSNTGTFIKTAGNWDTLVLGPFENAGTLAVQSGGLYFYDAYTQTAGSTVLDGGAVKTLETLDILGGAVTGNGTITGDVLCAGEMRPGFSPGLLTIAGDYVQTASGSLHIELASASGPGSGHDQLVVSGTAALAGALEVTLIDGFDPPLGSSYDVLSCANRTGAFEALSQPVLDGGRVAKVEYLPAVVRVSIALLGDIDDNGSVGVTDFLALLAAWGACPLPPTACPADLDGDGTVGILDFLALLGNWTP